MEQEGDHHTLSDALIRRLKEVEQERMVSVRVNEERERTQPVPSPRHRQLFLSKNLTFHHISQGLKHMSREDQHLLLEARLESRCAALDSQLEAAQEEISMQVKIAVDAPWPSHPSPRASSLRSCARVPTCLRVHL